MQTAFPAGTGVTGLADAGLHFGDDPGCEVRPSSGSDELCGDPADAVALCEVDHEHGCRREEERRMDIWLCRHHLEEARQRRLGCVPCGRPVTVLRLL